MGFWDTSALVLVSADSYIDSAVVSVGFRSTGVGFFRPVFLSVDVCLNDDPFRVAMVSNGDSLYSPLLCSPAAVEGACFSKSFLQMPTRKKRVMAV